VTSEALTEIWRERGLIGPAFAAAIGVGYLPLLVLPWTFSALVSQAGYAESQAGWIATSEIGALAVASFLASKWAARPGRRKLATAGALIAIIANTIAALGTPSGTVFLAARVASGAGLGVAVAAGNAAVAGSKNPTRAFAALWFLMALWQLAIFNVTPWIIGRAGLAGAYGFETVSFLAFLPLLWHIPDPPSFVPGMASLNQRSRTPRWSVILMVATVLAFWLRDALVFSMSASLAATVGITAGELGVLLGIASVAGLVGPAIAARIAIGTTSARMVAAALVVTLAVSTIMAIGLSATTFACATLLMPATGLFTAALLSGLAGELDATGRLVAICAGVGFLSEAVGPAIGGSAMENGGRMALSAAVLGVGALSVVTGVLAAAAARRRAEQGPTAPSGQSLSVPP
jgi:hypothetical protein